jgi:hypothetical protein
MGWIEITDAIRESEAEPAWTVPLAMLLAEFTQTGLQFA